MGPTTQPLKQTARAAAEHKQEVKSLNLNLSLQGYKLCLPVEPWIPPFWHEPVNLVHRFHIKPLVADGYGWKVQLGDGKSMCVDGRNNWLEPCRWEITIMMILQGDTSGCSRTLYLGPL